MYGVGKGGIERERTHTIIFSGHAFASSCYKRCCISTQTLSIANRKKKKHQGVKRCHLKKLRD